MHRLPDALRPTFQKPFGPVLQTTQLRARLQPDDDLVCVGDYVAKTALELGLRPKLIVVDFKTERKEVGALLKAIVGAYGKTVLRVASAPATISDELYVAVLQGLRLGGPVRIEVEGEEDLAGLVVLAEAQDGTVLWYGMPGEGVVLVRVDERARRTAKDLLAKMKA